MNTSTTSMDKSKPVVDFLTRKGMLAQLAGVWANLSLKRRMDQQLLNEEAENHYARGVWNRAAGNQITSSSQSPEDDMATTVVFGDYKVNEQPTQSGFSRMLPKLAIAAGLLASGAGGAIALSSLLAPSASQLQTIEKDYSIGNIEIQAATGSTAPPVLGPSTPTPVGAQ